MERLGSGQTGMGKRVLVELFPALSGIARKRIQGLGNGVGEVQGLGLQPAGRVVEATTGNAEERT